MGLYNEGGTWKLLDNDTYDDRWWADGQPKAPIDGTAVYSNFTLLDGTSDFMVPRWFNGDKSMKMPYLCEKTVGVGDSKKTKKSGRWNRDKYERKRFVNKYK